MITEIQHVEVKMMNGPVKDLNANCRSTKNIIVTFVKTFRVMRMNLRRLGMNSDAPELSMIIFIENVSFFGEKIENYPM